MLIAVVFFVGLLIPMGVIDAESSALSLASLCKGEKVHLRTISQLNSLIGELKSSDGGCSDTVKDALEDMKKLTDVTDEGVCTMDQAKAITDFVDKYLKDAPDGTKRGLPEPLEKFAIAYGMKVSGICSHRMVRELPMRTEFEYIMDFDAHFPKFIDIVSEESPLGNVLDPIVKTGEVILPVDFMQAIPDLVEHAHLLLPQQLGILKLKHYCEKFFQPLYEPLLLPLAHLIRAGFNNREHYWAWSYQYKGRLWSRVVFLCEMAKMVNPGQEAELSNAEEAAIAEALKKVSLGDLSVFQARNSLGPPSVEAKLVPLGDTIYGRFDNSMKSLVKEFDANKNHVQLLRERILKRCFRVARRMFKKKGFSAELTKTLKAARVESGSEADLEEAKKKFVNLMNSPQDDSTAYRTLVSSSKYVYDHVAGLIGLSIYLVPAFFLAVVGSKKELEKFAGSADHFFHNYMATRDMGADMVDRGTRSSELI